MNNKPRKVIRKQLVIPTSDGGFECWGQYSCPWCNEILFMGFPNRRIKFCPYCGKPVEVKGEKE